MWQWTGAANQAILLKIILGDMGKKKQGSVELYCDNKSAIAVVKKSSVLQQN